MGAITTHILDTMHGTPAKGVSIVLTREGTTLVSVTTNQDGRCDAPLLQGDDFQNRRYRLTFGIGAYYRNKGVRVGDFSFLDDVVIDFGVSDCTTHYHVPLLVSPYSYSTYRGS